MDPEDQPDTALTKKPGLALDKAYEAKFGAQQPQPVSPAIPTMPSWCSNASSRWR